MGCIKCTHCTCCIVRGTCTCTCTCMLHGYVKKALYSNQCTHSCTLFTTNFVLHVYTCTHVHVYYLAIYNVHVHFQLLVNLLCAKSLLHITSISHMCIHVHNHGMCQLVWDIPGQCGAIQDNTSYSSNDTPSLESPREWAGPSLSANSNRSYNTECVCTLL